MSYDLNTATMLVCALRRENEALATALNLMMDRFQEVLSVAIRGCQGTHHVEALENARDTLQTAHDALMQSRAATEVIIREAMQEQ